MTQMQLEAEVAEATGETMQEIRRRGFSIVRPDIEHDDEPEVYRMPLVVDWDAQDAQRRAA